MHSIDLTVQAFFLHARTPLGIEFMYVFTNLFNPVPFLLIILFSVILIYKRRGVLYSLLLTFSVILASGLAWTLKHITNIDRPPMAVILEADKSFPSGHVTLSTVFFGMLIYIFSPRLKGYKKILFNSFCVAMVMLISLSRLYLGVHWLSDILGGIILGSLVLYASIKLFKKYDKFIW